MNCEYCIGNEDGDTTLIVDDELNFGMLGQGGMGLGIDGNVMKMTVSAEGSPHDFKEVAVDIKFCPMCGRKL